MEQAERNKTANSARHPVRQIDVLSLVVITVSLLGAFTIY